MRLKFYFTLATIAGLISLQAQQTTNNNVATAAPLNWQQKATAWIQEKQLLFRSLNSQEFATINTKNSLVFQTNPSGYKIKSLHNSSECMAEFTISALNNVAWKNKRSTIKQEKNEVAYQFSNLKVEYVNGESGFRQNFIISKKEKGNNLSVAMKIAAKNLTPFVKDNQLSLHDSKGMPQLFYDDLHVWDANKNPLPASMELAGNEVRLVVDDRNAVYPVTIDPMSHAPAWTDNGNGLIFPLLNDLATPLLYGYSISDAGDVNGDGFGDVIVGAPTYVDITSISSGTYNVASVGAVFIYYGSASGLAATPSEVLQPTTQAGALFGFSISKAGDVNGDGFADVVVGAPGDHITLNVGVFPVATSVAAGKVYVYYGGPAGTFDGNVATEPTVSASLSLKQSDFGALISIPASPLYGFSVSNAGDVNGDGLGDILVGSPAYLRLLPLPVLSGRVDVYHGTATGISATPNQSITGTLLNGLFGFSVNTAGNVNGDVNAGRPISDIIVGAPGDLTLLGAGRAFVFHGSTSGITATSISQANTTLGSGLLTTLFGFSVSNAGDINGDGYSDVVVGEPAALESLLSQTASVGAVGIYYGSSSGVSASGGTTLNSPRRPSILGLLQGNLLFGYSVSAAGDVNCDGYADIIVGEPGGTALSLGSGLLNIVSTNVLAGQSYVYYGRSGGPVNSPGYTFGENGSVSVANLIGYTVSEGGDYNGDGKADLLIGAPNGTLSLSSGLIPAVGDALNIVMANSVGSAYGYTGCLQQTTLPIHLESFTGAKQNSNVVVNWKVSNEETVDKYAVERSNDGVGFKTIGLVFAANTAGTVPYRFKDTNPQAVNFYRLRTVTKEGQATYSDIVRIDFGKEDANAITVSPNPVSDDYTLQVSGLAPGKYKAVVYSASGVAQQTVQFPVTASQHLQHMTRGQLAAGIYFIQVTNANGTVVGGTRLVCQ